MTERSVRSLPDSCISRAILRWNFALKTKNKLVVGSRTSRLHLDSSANAVNFFIFARDSSNSCSMISLLSLLSSRDASSLKKKQINATVVAVKSFVIGAGGVRFDYQVDQIGHNVANEPPIAATFPRSCVVQALSHGNDPDTRYTLRCNASHIMRIWC